MCSHSEGGSGSGREVPSREQKDRRGRQNRRRKERLAEDRGKVVGTLGGRKEREGRMHLCLLGAKEVGGAGGGGEERVPGRKKPAHGRPGGRALPASPPAAPGAVPSQGTH